MTTRVTNKPKLQIMLSTIDNGYLVTVEVSQSSQHFCASLAEVQEYVSQMLEKYLGAYDAFSVGS